MAASSSSSATAEPRSPEHHVFLSFRGKDTRNGFTSHLYKALSKKGIKAYKDDINLKKGDTISPALLEAIEKSEISIIIFSKNYASSRWCLDELVHILKCKKKEEARTVLPIFIGIDPWHIRHQKGTYAEAFVKHEERFEMEKVQEWKQALNDAAAISGWDSGELKDEAQIVEKVVEHVKVLHSKKSKRSGDFVGLVGIQDRLKKIESFLGSQTIRIIGIWGMGGIGKTWLARVVYDRFHNDFDSSCFASKVGERAIDDKGLETLKKKVYSELLGEKDLNIFKSSDVNDGLSRKKILLVLDDVKDHLQFEDLAGDTSRFFQGSKIIVTSRVKLNIVDEQYKVELLDSNDACELFRLKAFRHKSCPSGYEEISGRVVKYANGHPLALEVLGLNVFGPAESITDWKKQLEKLERTPNDQILKVLERSYDALDAEEKGLFLDIACFFEGERRDFVEGILEDKPITGLVNKSLITIEGGEIHMHYLIQVMGREIVLRSTQKLGERSRLWIAKDVSDVLKNNEGTDAIEGIYLPWNKEVEEVHLTQDVFKEMRELRLLKFYDKSGTLLGKVKFVDGDLRYLPNSLRYLHWEQYPGNSLPTDFNPQNLVELHMPCSENLQSLPANIGELNKLKKLDISKCKNLRSLPELPFFIVSVNADDCSSLEMVSTLRSTLTLERWLDKYDSDYYQSKFSFLNCTKLGEDAINNIFREFLYKVFCTATIPPEVVVPTAQRVIRELLVCYPTKKIPRWFSNRCEGSSITFTLLPNWYNAKTFLGFVVSVIFAEVDFCLDSLKCELHLKTNCGESLEEVFEYRAYNRKSSGLDNMVVWYKYFDNSKAKFGDQEASLKFESPHAGVKMCGVRMLYRKDEKSDDGKTPKIEPWRTYDSDEPPTKRSRNEWTSEFWTDANFA